MAFLFSIGVLGRLEGSLDLFDFEMPKKLSFEELLQIIDLTHKFLARIDNDSVEEILVTFQHMFADAVITIDANLQAYGLVEEFVYDGLLFSFGHIELRLPSDMIQLKNMICDEWSDEGA